MQITKFRNWDKSEEPRSYIDKAFAFLNDLDNRGLKNLKRKNGKSHTTFSIYTISNQTPMNKYFFLVKIGRIEKQKLLLNRLK